MSILKALEEKHGGRKILSEKAGVKPDALSHASKSKNVVGYTYNLAKRLDSTFKLQIVEDGHLITISREKL